MLSHWMIKKNPDFISILCLDAPPLQRTIKTFSLSKYTIMPLYNENQITIKFMNNETNFIDCILVFKHEKEL